MKLTKYLVLAILMSSVVSIHAQNVTSTLAISGQTNTRIKSVVIDTNSNNIYAFGWATGDLTIGDTVITEPVLTIPSQTRYTFLTKLDSNKKVVWNTFIDYEFGLSTSSSWPGAIALDSNENVYITDTHSGNAYLDTFTFSSSVIHPTIGYITYKYDIFGNFIWAKNFGGRKIDVVVNNYLQLTGLQTYSDSINGDEITNPYGTVLLIDLNGVYLDHVQIDSVNYNTENIEGRDNNGNYFGYRQINGGSSCEFIKVDSSGNIILSKGYDGGIGDGRNIVYDNNNDVFYLSRFFYLKTPLDATTGPVTDQAPFIVKFDSDFNPIAQLQIGPLFIPGGGYVANELTIKVLNNSIFIMMDWDHSSSGLAPKITSLGNSNYIFDHDHQISLIKLSTNLEVKWIKDIPSSWYAQILKEPLKLADSLLVYCNAPNFMIDSLLAGFPNWTASGGHGHLLTMTDNDISHNHFIEGFIFKDFNQDGVFSINEQPYPHLPAKNNAFDIIKYTDFTGHYSLPGKFGDQTVKSISLPQYWQWTTPDSIELNNVVLDSNIYNQNFGLAPIPGITDLELDIIAITAARPGFDVQYIVNICNIGTDTANAVLTLEQDTLLSIKSSTIPYDSVVNNYIYYNFGNIAPDSCFSFLVTDSLVNSVNLFGIFINQSGVLMTVQNDTTPDNNVDFVDILVTGSYDPNDISVNPKCDITDNFIQENRDLEYLIRFQNTGTDTAFNVTIVDTLSNNMDLTTFEFVSASHPVNISIIGEVLKLQFNYILLPDSATNLIESRGYFKYLVQPKTTMIIGDSIQNTAHIFFDFNPAIITNTVSTSLIGLNELFDYTVTSSSQCSDHGNIVISSTCQHTNSNIYTKLDSNQFYLNTESIVENVPNGYHTLSITNGIDTVMFDSILIEMNNSFPTLDLFFCYGDSILIGTKYRSEPGIYFDSTSSILGCDSISEINLIANQPSIASDTLSICLGDSILIYGDFKMIAGVYFDTLQNTSGCDSIIETNLSLIQPYIIHDSLSVCFGDSIVLAGTFQNLSGIYIDTLQAFSGCDSILVQELSILPETEISFSSFIQDTFCLENIEYLLIATIEGGQYNGAGVISNNFNPELAGIGIHLITYTYIDSNSCYSSDSINLVVQDCLNTFDIEQASISIFPNPTNGSVNIVRDFDSVFNIKVINAMGQVVHYEKNITLKNYTFEIDSVSGVYIVEVEFQNRTFRYRIVKN